MKNMRITMYLLAFAILMSLTVTSCSPRVTSGMPAIKRSAVVGTWNLSTIDYEGITASNVTTIFSEQNPNCFMNSNWILNNNGTGSFAISEGNSCRAINQRIYWSAALSEDTFQFKKLNDGEKATDVSDGYRMVIYSATGNELVLKLPIEVASGNANVKLTFNRVSK